MLSSFLILEFQVYIISSTCRIVGIVAKGAKCNVNGCDDDGVRSLNTTKVENAGLEVSSTGKKTVLCKTHYKEWKKESKDDRDLERARYDKF